MYTHRGAYLNALGEIIHQRFDPRASICGRCRCSTAAAGARRAVTGPVRRTYVCGRYVRT